MICAISFHSCNDLCADESRHCFFTLDANFPLHRGTTARSNWLLLWLLFVMWNKDSIFSLNKERSPAVIVDLDVLLRVERRFVPLVNCGDSHTVLHGVGIFFVLPPFVLGPCHCCHWMELTPHALDGSYQHQQTTCMSQYKALVVCAAVQWYKTLIACTSRHTFPRLV